MVEGSLVDDRGRGRSTPPGKAPVMPTFIYGTAWKEDETARLTRLALACGFRAIDTANQRRHYHEAAVGEALSELFGEGRITRQEVFLQTKFTSLAGQDQRLPFDPRAAVAIQVHQSCASSLEHLGVERLDCYLLHGPAGHSGLAPADLEAWQAMEELRARGATRLIGVSNFSVDQLETLCEHAATPPAVVQNRCFARLGWDREVRAVCRERGIAYQAFSLLTANLRELASPAFRRLVERVRRTPAQVVFRFAQQVGMVPLTGTGSPDHMREDLGCAGFDLSPGDLRLIETLAV